MPHEHKRRKQQIICKARNSPEAQESVDLLKSLKVSSQVPNLCLKCSVVLQKGADPLFCRTCYESPEVKSMFQIKDLTKKKRIEVVLQRRKELQEKISGFAGKTYAEIANQRDISLSEAIKLTNSLLNAGYLVPSPECEKREGLIVFQFPVFDDFIFCT
jgi:tRNA G26 N,N-dimethylase Trm1